MYAQATSAESGNWTDFNPLAASELSGDPSTLTLLSGACGRNRAVDNDYSDHPVNQRSYSSSSGVQTQSLLPDQPRQREQFYNRDVSRLAQGLGHRRHRPPGSATRVGSLPDHLTTRSSSGARRTVLTNRDDQPSQLRTTPVVPPRVYPHTVGHLPSRSTAVADLNRHALTNRPAPPVPPHICNAPVAFTLGNSTPPARPPPPSAELAARLGVPKSQGRDEIGCKTEITVNSPPVSLLTTDNMQRVVSTQPKTTSSEHVRKTGEGIVDSTSEKLWKHTNGGGKDEVKNMPKLSKNSSTNSSLKKSTDYNTVVIGGNDDDHQIMGPGSGLELRDRAGIKPGDHNYPCPRCGKCMCPRCQGDDSAGVVTPRVIGHCWMCNHRCLCDVDSCVDVATCLCCVRACFYHCSNYDDDETFSDKPCSCKGSRCCLRWSLMGALSIFLPCLLCYPVARGCVLACRSCAACMKPGCRCKESYR